MCVLVTEIQTVDGGQKDALLRATLKKNKEIVFKLKKLPFSKKQAMISLQEMAGF